MAVEEAPQMYEPNVACLEIGKEYICTICPGCALYCDDQTVST